MYYLVFSFSFAAVRSNHSLRRSASSGSEFHQNLQMALQPKAGTTPCLRRILMRFSPAPAKNVWRRIVRTTSLFATPIIFTACGTPGSQIGNPGRQVAPTVVQVQASSGSRVLRHRVQALRRRVQVLGQLIQSLHRLYFFLTGQAPTAMFRPSNPSSVRSSSATPRRTRVNSMA